MGQPFGVLSLLPYSQTLVPPLPLSTGSLFRSAPSGVRAQPWGLRPLSRDISSGFSDSLFFPSALFNSPVASFRRFGRFLRQVFTGSRTGRSGHQLTSRSPDSRGGRASGARNRSQRQASWRTAPVHSPGSTRSRQLASNGSGFVSGCWPEQRPTWSQSPPPPQHQGAGVSMPHLKDRRSVAVKGFRLPRSFRRSRSAATSEVRLTTDADCHIFYRVSSFPYREDVNRRWLLKKAGSRSQRSPPICR